MPTLRALCALLVFASLGGCGDDRPRELSSARPVRTPARPVEPPREPDVSTPCARLDACCAAMAARPELAGVHATCVAMVPQLLAMGDAAQGACDEGLRGLVRGLGQATGVPAVCVSPEAPMVPMAPARPVANLPLPGRGACNRFRRCCEDIARNPMMHSVGETCVRIRDLEAMGPQADAVCEGGIATLVAQLGSVPDFPLPASCSAPTVAMPAGDGRTLRDVCNAMAEALCAHCGGAADCPSGFVAGCLEGLLPETPADMSDAEIDACATAIGLGDCAALQRGDLPVECL